MRSASRVPFESDWRVNLLSTVFVNDSERERKLDSSLSSYLTKKNQKNCIKRRNNHITEKRIC